MLSPTGASDSKSLADDPLAGQPYRALQLLGAGGMGEVFLAEHRKLATPCVVKIQHTRLARDPSVADRIRLEAESLARLNHPNIVAILGCGQTLDERPYIVMEYLRGQTMADELAARGQLPLLEALDYTCQLLRGLAQAHAVGIVHRDIKPDNLFLCDGPRSNRVLKLLDFGVALTMPDALPLGPNPLAVPTATGSVVGALRYVSPEGALARRVDHRADLYSAALVLYFALAGRGPFDHIQSALLLLSAHVAEQPEPPSHFSKAGIPAELDRAVLRALRKAPGERFQSADELREELERIMNQLRLAPQPSDVRSSPQASPPAPPGLEIPDLGTASNSGLHRDAASGARIRSSRVLGADDAPSDQAGPLRIGARFLDKYEIKKQIGRGGQAWVYLGQHIFTAREVAIKVVHSSRGMTREMLERGKAEARALGKLDHPNIVVMHDAGVTDDGLFYIVMELLRGRSLRSALAAHRRFAVDEVLQLAMQAAEAVQVAHEIGLIHRDLTPDNIYLTRDNRVKVLDFGIAKVLNEIGFTTHKDIVMGSILYMSPEQVQGLPLSPRSDICALGLMMFEMLIGKHPILLVFERDLQERSEPLRRAMLAEIPPIQMNRMPPMLSELDSSIPMHLAQVVHRAIAKNAEARFSTMRDFVSALRVCRETLGSEAPIALERTGQRDLSLRVAGESDEPPASQRATPRRGLTWDGAGALTPVPSRDDLLAVTAAIRAVAASEEASSRSAPARTVAARRSPAWVRNAIIASCLFGAALATLGALKHFEGQNPVAPEAPQLGTLVIGPTSTTNAVVASLSPALPIVTPEAEHGLPLQPERERPTSTASREGSSHPSPAPALRHAAPTSRPNRTATTATVSVNAGDKIADVSLPLEIGPGSKRHQAQASSAEEPRKRLNGGRLIYGD